MTSPPPIPSYFLCPTGKGDNSSTLERQVLDGCPLWGFTEGSAKRFRPHIKPGDVLVFGAPGTGRFNRVGVVKEWRDDLESAVSGRFWAPMDYCMGGKPKKGVRFTMLVLLSSVTEVDMEKVGRGAWGGADFFFFFFPVLHTRGFSVRAG